MSERFLRPIRTEGDDVIRVFHGERQIGRVRTVRCGQFEALSESGRNLGLFNSAHGAAQAMLQPREADHGES